MKRITTPSGKAMAPRATVMSHSRELRCAVLVNSDPISTIKYYICSGGGEEAEGVTLEWASKATRREGEEGKRMTGTGKQDCSTGQVGTQNKFQRKKRKGRACSRATAPRTKHRQNIRKEKEKQARRTSFRAQKKWCTYLQNNGDDDDGNEERVLVHAAEHVPVVEDGPCVQLVEDLAEHECVE